MSGWWTLDSSTGQPVGPYDLKALQGLISNGYVTESTPLWKDGAPEWLKLGEIEELQPLVQVAAEVAKAGKKKVPEAPADELAAFQAEINALEAAGTEGGEDEGGGDATPEELEFEDDDGTIYIWDKKLRKYMPKGGASVGPGSEGGAGYDMEAMTYTGDDEVIPSLKAAVAGEEGAAAEDRKRKATEAGGPSSEADAGAAEGAPAAAPAGPAGRRNKKQKGQPAAPAKPAEWFELKNNTSVYVTGLPLDVTVEEVVTVFSKYGLIKEDEQRQPRIKLYRDKATGSLKGDALVTYLREPSVPLACQLLDGAPFRADSTTNMTVTVAKFEMKGERYEPKAKAISKKERKMMLQKQEKLLTWGGFDDKLTAEKSTVILRNMFAAGEVALQSEAEELEGEISAECAKCGPVDKVRVFKDHPQGVVSVRFTTAEGVAACLARMSGRFFAGRQIAAEMWDGVTNYAAVKVKESEAEQEARLEAYARELESRAAAKAAAEAAAAAAGGAAPAAAGGADAGGADAAGGDVTMS
uniref:RRM domain-containing protein n=1 Tax=Chlamydomonas leiostraca TaxID=1034604 RepID=A0A7S0RM91_9CHLO